MAQLWKKVQPCVIVHSTKQKTVFVSKSRRVCKDVEEDSHSNAGDGVGRVPKADISTSGTTGWWIPRHDKQVKIHENRHDDRRVPCTKFRSGNTELLATISDDIQANSHQEGKCACRVYLKIRDCCPLAKLSFGEISLLLTKVERIAGRRCEDHDHGDTPFDEVWSGRSAKRFCGCPELWEREDALPSAFSNDTRLSNHDGNQVAKRAQSDE